MKNEIIDEAEAHTLAKHRILEEYLKGWLPVLGQGQRNRLLYFDGFAGCGELTEGHPGSPVVAIRTAMQAHAGQMPLEVRMVEKKADKCEYLRGIIEREKSDPSLPGNIIIHDPVCGECEVEVTKLLNDHARARQKLGPALFFLDQYGYSGFSMSLVRRILENAMCETFSYLNWQRMHPYFADATKAAAFTRALGGEEWRNVQPLADQARVAAFKSIYVKALRERAGAKYVYDFAMRGQDHRLIYWLFFCTNDLKGLEVMKKAMWKVDPTGRFEFSDEDVDQNMLLGYTQSALADDLDKELRGREVTSVELYEHVLTRTPEYRSAEAISILKDRGCVKQQRRADGTVYTFCAPPMRTGNLFGE